MKSTIYHLFREELHKRYTFTRSGNERRYNNMLKLKNKTEDEQILKYIDFVLEQYNNFINLKMDIDIYGDIPGFQFNYGIDGHTKNGMTGAICTLRNKIHEIEEYCNEMESKDMPEWQIIASRNGWKPCN